MTDHYREVHITSQPLPRKRLCEKVGNAPSFGHSGAVSTSVTNGSEAATSSLRITRRDITSYVSVADLFANPPEWLPKQLEVYRQNPQKHIKPLCTAVAAVVLEDGMRGDEVRDEVERALFDQEE